MFPLFKKQNSFTCYNKTFHVSNLASSSCFALDEVPVRPPDQPLYATGKQSNSFNLKVMVKRILLFGGLHIELCALKALGKW